MQNEVVGLDNILDPSYTDKDFLGVPEEEEYDEEILFSFAPNYSADIPVALATVYGTPKALADYQFEYFRKKNEIAPKLNGRISLKVYLLTGNILGEAKDVAAFQFAYEKLLEKSTANDDVQQNEVSAEEKIATDENLNNPDFNEKESAEKLFEEATQSANFYSETYKILERGEKA